MQSIEQNLSLLERIVDEFEPFILSAEIFWTLDHKGIRGTPPPRLTLGGLLLILDELSAQNPEMTPKEAMRYDKLIRKVEGIHGQWRVAVENKAGQELKARLNMWRAYLQDLEEKHEWIENYSREVRTRVMLHHLMAIIGSKPELETEYKMINNLDKRIWDFVIPGKFIWDDLLQPIYPKEKFPYLYTRPRDSFTH
jgi:hypothetical protein